MTMGRMTGGETTMGRNERIPYCLCKSFHNFWTWKWPQIGWNVFFKKLSLVFILKRVSKKLLRWPNTVCNCPCLISHDSLTIYAWRPSFCKSQDQPQKGNSRISTKVYTVAMTTGLLVTITNCFSITRRLLLMSRNANTKWKGMLYLASQTSMFLTQSEAKQMLREELKKICTGLRKTFDCKFGWNRF